MVSWVRRREQIHFDPSKLILRCLNKSIKGIIELCKQVGFVGPQVSFPINR